MKSKIFTIGALSLLSIGALVSLGTSSVYAYQGDATKVGPNHTEEREVAMDKVIETKDFNGWKVLMNEDGRTPGVLKKVTTQDAFNKFALAHELTDQGKTAEANAIRAELGLGTGMGKGKGNGGSFIDANKDGVCDNIQ